MLKFDCVSLPRMAGMAAIVIGAMAFSHHPVQAQDSVADFYRGKNIDLYIGFSPGGTYDSYARLVARFMSKHIPGQPNIVPKQMPGAGGRLAANFMYSVAPKDGTQLATADQALALQQVMGEPGIQFDANEFNWIGNPIADNNTMAAWHTSGLTSIEQAKEKEYVVGANGITASAQYPQAMNVLLGTKFKIITGYPGGTEVNLAMERGEVAIRGQNSWSSWKANHAKWLADKHIHILVQMGLERNPELADVPLLMELATKDEDREVLKLLSTPTAIGRPLFTTPGVPAERVAALREAFNKTMKDPEFLEAASKANMDLNPVGGAQLQEIVAGVTQTSKDVVARLKEILAPLHQN